MEIWDIKDRLTGDVQRKANGKVYIQALRTELECIVRMKNDSYHVVFFYNDNQEKKWEFSRKKFPFLTTFGSNLICAFVCKNEWDLEEYHLITFNELIGFSKIEFDEFWKEDKLYYFEDEGDLFKEDWEIFERG